MMSEKIKINIYNREYEIDPGGLTPLEVSALAQYVTEKMKEIETQTTIVDTAKLAVLAALNITEELFQLKATRTMVDGSMDKQYENLITMLDAVLVPGSVSTNTHN
ncbi:MAG: cell division protein ZapA [Elusimicrobia bacterium]|nr:cell division protein ZapA [Elusimicrobiota bacterium]MBD3411537.1 cell division protein ZapA [Elusimicrobiota bacterium]